MAGKAHQSTDPRGENPPRWWPLAARLLGPVLALTLVALWTLVRDVRAARRETLAAATELGEAVANRVDSLFAAEFPDARAVGSGRGTMPPGRIRVGPSNELLRPRTVPWPPAPVPIPDLEDPGIAEAWRLARGSVPTAENAATVIRAWERFLAQSQPAHARHRGIARWERALALELAGRPGGPAEAWQAVLDEAPPGEMLALTETGVPVGHLAALRLVEWAGQSGGLDNLPPAWRRESAAFVRRLAGVESRYLGELFERLAPWAEARVAEDPEQRAAWEALRRERQRAGRLRQFHQEARRQWNASQPWPAAFWVQLGSGRCLAVEALETAVPSMPPDVGAGDVPASGRDFACLPEADIREALGEVLLGFDRRGIFRLGLEIAGFEVDAGGGIRRPSMETESLVTLRRATPTGAPYRIVCALSDPAGFRRSLWRRTAWFGGLLAATFLLAVVAVWATHRTLLRQHELGRQRSNFVSSVSHELRAPLASIRLLAEGLERGTILDPERRSEYHRLIVRETRRLGALVENVLDFSRIEQGRKRFDFELTDLRALVVGTVSLMEPLASERGVRLVLDLPSTGVSSAPFTAGEGAPMLEVLADGRALQQALLNLIDNGLKHSPEAGELVVTLRIEEVLSGRREGPCRRLCRIGVRDSGPGIPASELGRIFEPFHRLGSELRRETEGVGIGLSIVKHIMDAHGGTVEVESEPGRGSVFSLRLPCDC